MKLRKSVILILLLFFFARNAECQPGKTKSSYNIVIILADDLGYNDLGCYGGEKITPNIDRLAESGMKFTEFYASPICSPTRAALLTGCYPQRVGIPSVLSSASLTGINPDELLLPEILKDRAYQTALFGKWHLGGSAVFHPQRNGFDEFFGTPASNDTGFDMDIDSRRYGQPGLVLMDGTDTVAINPPQWKLVRQYTERSVDFINRNSSKPFFLYLAYNMPHTPIFVSNDFTGKSKIDLYHDVLTEIDWSVGKILHTLEERKIRDKTLVVFISDNGPWLIFGNHGGSAYPFSGGKKQTLEGGVRVPAIFSLPGIIPGNSKSNELTTIMDVYPTVADLTNLKMTMQKIDGRSILPLISREKDAKSPHEAYYYYYENALQAVRAGNYKLQLPHPDTQTPDPARIGYDGFRGNIYTVKRPLALYNLRDDPAEQTDISSLEPGIVQQLLKIAEDARNDLGDSLEGISGKGVRKPGNVIAASVTSR